MSATDFANGDALDISRSKSNDGSGSITKSHELGGGNYQGDLQLTPEQFEVIAENKAIGRALTLIRHWPRVNGIVTIPYVMSVCDYTDNEKARLARAISEYEDNTCIRYEKGENHEIKNKLNVI